ncbi:MAG: methylmalonyl-CoA epimerase [Thermoplasmata archaeon]|nr:methylmalonyl-CoA epimerase [Thermoplasmata archaeon]
MLLKVDHIGIAVNNIDETLSFYRDQLGLTLGGIEEVPEQKVKVAFMQLGESRLELLESTDPDGPVAKFIEKRGQGIQHIAIGVDNIDETLESLKATGAMLIDEKPRIGAGGAKIAFVHPKSTRGVLLEICQR